MDSVEPLLKSPFTDVFGHLVDSQFLGRCADLEIDSYNCAEAYGLGKTGREKCFNLIEDLKECITYKLQTKRFLVIISYVIIIGSKKLR